jgi:hypothetical protein
MQQCGCGCSWSQRHGWEQSEVVLVCVVKGKRDENFKDLSSAVLNSKVWCPRGAIQEARYTQNRSDRCPT